VTKWLWLAIVSGFFIAKVTDWGRDINCGNMTVLATIGAFVWAIHRHARKITRDP
jgi:hypothetical protein